jgi:threonine/homoserine/homoserine lactone efflux protein
VFGFEPSVLAGFIATSVAIIISPGPDTIIILRHAINGGRGPGLAAVGGVQMGLVLHACVAAGRRRHRGPPIWPGSGYKA